MLLNIKMASASLWENFVSWLDESLGVSLKEEYVEDRRKSLSKKLSGPPEIHNRKMRVKVIEWLKNLPDDVEPLDEEDDDICLTEEEMAIYEELVKKQSGGKTEKNPLEKILNWLEELKVYGDKEEEKKENEKFAALKRCQSVEDFLSEKMKHNHLKENDTLENEVFILNDETIINIVPSINVVDNNEEQLWNDPYLDESASTRINHCELESVEDVDNDDNRFTKRSKDNKRKLKLSTSPKYHIKKLGNYLSPPKTVYRQRANSDISNESAEKDVNFDMQKQRNSRKPRSFSDGDVYPKKDYSRMERFKKRIEKRKKQGKKGQGLALDVSEDELEKNETATAEKTQSVVKRRLVRLVVNQAKYTLNGY